MADNITVKDAADADVVVAGDAIGGFLHQRVKLVHGIDGTNDGDVATSNPLPVGDAGGSLTVDGTVTANLGTIGGAATAAKQPALGTAGTASTDVITIQGIASGTVVPVADGGGSLTVDGAISFTAPQHVIVDSGTVTTVSTVTAVTSITNAVVTKGGTAADAALANAPVTIGGRATNTNLAEMSADGDVVDLQMTMQGALVTAGAPRELLGSQKTTLSATTTETTIITAASGVYNDLYAIHLANSGGTPTLVDIRDDTAGSVRDSIMVPAGETRGWHGSAGSALSQTATNKNWTAKCSAATTALEVTALYVKRK